MKTMKKVLSLLLCVMLMAALALGLAGCSTGEPDPTTDPIQESPLTVDEVKGEGETMFYLTVVDAEGNETVFEIHTDETIVGKALLALELIAGDESEFGLYVKTVNGTTLDYDADGMYWSFYVGGEYAMTGVDATEITAGSVYTFKAESAE